MTRIVTLYNHKGGVSKTTTTYHLAHALTEHLHKKVLVVDADPQCNVSELCLSQLIEELDAKEEAGVATDLPGTTVRDALWPRLDGDRPDVDIAAISLVQPYGPAGPHLFRGDIALSEAEDRLSYAHSQRLTTDMHQKRTYIAIHDMLRRLGHRDQFDVILVDVGPSAGALTRSFFLSCDVFFVPVAPDRFNLQAIGSLEKILDKWIHEHTQVVADFKKLGLNVAQGRPEFGGLIMQRFQRHAGSPKPSYKIWIDRISKRAGEELVPCLIAAGGAGVVNKRCLTSSVAVEVPDFASIAPMMLAKGKPAWRLTQQDTDWRGNVWEDRKKAMNEIRELFFEFAEKVVA